jgi:ATP-dependent RNA helicase RhlE
VVVYDLPHEPETYVHRIGRTGRAGLSGKAVAFCDHEERPRLRAIEKLLRKPIPVRTDVPQFAAVESTGSSERGESSGRGDSSRRSGRRSGGGDRTVIGGRQDGPRFGKKRRKGSTEPRAVFEARTGREAGNHGEARNAQDGRRSGKPGGRSSAGHSSAVQAAPAGKTEQKPGKRHRRAL